MIYLKKFELLDEDKESHYRSVCKIGKGLFDRNTPDEYYPLGLFNPNFSGQRIKQLDFEDITIVYGGNGSGKTTLLNIMAEKLEVFRYKKYLQTEAFAYYISNCEYDTSTKTIPPNSKFLASDDIFEHILTVREENKGVKSSKNEEQTFRYKDYRDLYPDGVHIDFGSPDVQKDLEQLERFNMARRKTRRQFIRSRAGVMQRQYSNGENALMFFDKNIEQDALYFLDEPENSMSPKFQLELKTFIEDSVRYKNCQFIIATHSPFILSLYDAKIYNLDATPVTVERWFELENMRYYYDFFKMNKDFFDLI